MNLKSKLLLVSSLFGLGFSSVVGYQQYEDARIADIRRQALDRAKKQQDDLQARAEKVCRNPLVNSDVIRKALETISNAENMSDEELADAINNAL